MGVRREMRRACRSSPNSSSWLSLTSRYARISFTTPCDRSRLNFSCSIHLLHRLQLGPARSVNIHGVGLRSGESHLKSFAVIYPFRSLSKFLNAELRLGKFSSSFAISWFRPNFPVTLSVFAWLGVRSLGSCGLRKFSGGGLWISGRQDAALSAIFQRHRSSWQHNAIM